MLPLVTVTSKKFNREPDEIFQGYVWRKLDERPSLKYCSALLRLFHIYCGYFFRHHLKRWKASFLGKCENTYEIIRIKFNVEVSSFQKQQMHDYFLFNRYFLIQKRCYEIDFTFSEVYGTAEKNLKEAMKEFSKIRLRNKISRK